MSECNFDLSCYGLDPRQVLPTAEEWAEFEKVVNKYILSAGRDLEHSEVREGKLILLNKVVWANERTCEKIPVYNMPIMARSDCSNRPLAIIKISKDVWEGRAWNRVSDWKFADHYHHLNLSSDHDCFSLVGTEHYDFEQSLNLVKYEITCQYICSPITMHEFYKHDGKTLTAIYKGQLMGQNTNSRYQGIYSLENAWDDKAVQIEYDGYVLPNASLVQLLTRQSLSNLRNVEIMRNSLDSLVLPKSDKEVMVKYRNDYKYRLVSRVQYEQTKEDVSSVYPVIEFADIQNIVTKLPKQDVDVICCGLGSAGTGILDQLSRSTYAESYLLIDPDTIEAKNIRNQWYTNQDKNMTKVQSSGAKLRNNRVVDNIMVYEKACKFQEVNLETYKAKYTISGFDSIEARLELFNLIADGKLETKYLIDTRYDELTASVFVVDTSDEKQMKRYLKGLEADLEAFNVREAERKEREGIKTAEQWLEYFEANKGYTTSCAERLVEIGVFTAEDVAENRECTFCPIITNITESFCGKDACKEYIKSLFEEHKDKIAELRRVDIAQAESSCVRQNFIDIYKYASSFVFSAIREIESGEPKPFTHVEVQTDVFPSHMIVQK